MSQALGLALRHLAVTVIWVLVAGLAAAAGCWCCGYIAREAWLKAGPPSRRPKQETAGDDVVSPEVARGIEEIEAYLTAACSPRPRPPHLDGGA